MKALIAVITCTETVLSGFFALTLRSKHRNLENLWTFCVTDKLHYSVIRHFRRTGNMTLSVLIFNIEMETIYIYV
jgi:hypothetical protein